MADHPFTHSETTNIELQVADKSFHVHRIILEFYSPVFEEMFKYELDAIETKNKTQSLVIDDVDGEIMAEYLKFFYPEHSKKINFDVGNETVDKLMSLSHKYQTPWISTPIEDYIINKKDGGEFVSMDFVNYENCARNIQGMLMAQRYGWETLDHKLIHFDYCPFEQLQQIKGFTELSLDSQLKLATKRIPKAVDESGSVAAFKLINEILRENAEREKEEDNEEINNEITLFKARDADWMVVSSGDDEDEISFMVHSKILQFYFEKFQIDKMVEMIGVKGRIKLEEVDEDILKLFFSFLYANQIVELKETTKFDKIIALLKEYQINWAIEQIEDYLIHSNIFNKPEKAFFDERERNQFNGLVLADKYKLIRLRKSILKKIEIAKKVASYSNKDLSAETKYLLVRKCVQQNPLQIQNGEFSDEGKVIIQFLDKHMR